MMFLQQTQAWKFITHLQFLCLPWMCILHEKKQYYKAQPYLYL